MTYNHSTLTITATNALTHLPTRRNYNIHGITEQQNSTDKTTYQHQ